jgi:regulator of sigma E protease
MDSLYWLAALLSLAFLIVVHEAGHYLVARWCGMRVERFSIGFGPGILKRRSAKTGTVFQLAPIPFGGFVEIRGMNIAEEVDPDDRFAYPNRPVLQRVATIFAGPATNYLSAIVLAFALYTCHGHDVPHWYGVGEVIANGASAGQLLAGDRILAFDHKPLAIEPDGPTLGARVNADNGGPVTLTLQRAGLQLDVTIQPKQEKDDHGHPVWRIGIKPEEQFVAEHVGVLSAARDALVYPIVQTQVITRDLWHIISGKEQADPGGVVRITDEFAKAWRLGLVTGIKLLMLLSVYIGLFNLFPLPALDGGKLVFLGYELVTRRRANPKIEAIVHMAGIMMFGILMVLVTVRDISHL